MDHETWRATYLDLGANRPPRRRCVTYRRLARELSGVEIDATYADVLARLEAHKADDPEFWRGLLAVMRTLPPETDWFTAIERLCDWLHRENPSFVRGLFMDWVLEER